MSKNRNVVIRYDHLTDNVRHRSYYTFSNYNYRPTSVGSILYLAYVMSRSNEYG